MPEINMPNIRIDEIPFSSHVGRIMTEQLNSFRNHLYDYDIVADKNALAYLYSCFVIREQYYEANKIMRFVNTIMTRTSDGDPISRFSIEVNNDSTTSE